VEYYFTVNSFAGTSPYGIIVNIDPLAGGSVTRDMDPPYNYGDLVNLTESPNLGYAFSGWSGDGSGNDTTRTVTVTGVMAVTATFSQAFDHFDITGYPSSVNASQSFGGITVTACDAANNTVTGYSGHVYFESSDAQATLPFTSSSEYTFTVGDAGIHTFSGFTLNTGGSQTITVTDGTISATSNPITVNTTIASKLVYTVGTGQSLTAGQVSSVITVQRQAQNGNPTTTGDITVGLTSTSGGGTFYSDPGGTVEITQVTISDGSSSASFYYNDTVAGNPTLDASSVNLTVATTQFTISAGAAARFAFNVIGTQTAGSAFGITVTAEDTYGNTVTSYVGTPTLTYSAGTINPSSIGPFAGGVGTISVTVTTAGMGVTITATDGSLTGTSNTFNVNVGPLASFGITGCPSSSTAGQSFGSNNVVVTAYDAYGNVITDYTGSVWFTSTDAQATLPYTSALLSYTFTASDNGVQTFPGVGFTLHTPGNQTITVTDGTISNTSSSIIVGLGSFVFNAISSPQTAGTAFNITITATDQYGKVMTNYAGTATLSDLSGSIMPSTATFTGGVCTVSVTITKAYTNDIITATDSADDLTGPSSSFTVNSLATATKFLFSTIGAQVAGTPFSVTITAVDQYGNTVTSYAGTATLADDTGSMSPTTGVFVNGVCTVSVTITKAYTGDAITATDSSSGLTGQSSSFSINAGSLASFTIGTIISPQSGGTAFSITITAQDAYGNTVTSYTGSASLSDLTGSLSPTSTSAFSAGVWTGNVKVNTAYTNDVITATSSGATGQSNEFNVVVGSLDHFVFNLIGTQTAGTPFSITITAEDAGGNIVTNYAGAISFSDLSGSLVLVNSGVFNQGVLTGSVYITKAWTGDTITATNVGTSANGTSNAFNVVAAGATRLVYTAGASQSITTSTVSSVITVQLEDANGNPVTATSSVTVNLATTATTTGTFWSNSGGTTKITSITIPSGSSSGSFYYSDTAAGTPTITASSTGLTSATTTFTISADKLVFYEGASQTLYTGQTSTAIEIAQETPTGGDDYNILSTTTITITTTSPTGEFSTTVGGTLTHSITVTVGILSYTSGTFYYVDSAAGTPTLTASASGFMSGTTTFTIYTPKVSSFKITATNYNVAVNTPFTITITAIDQEGNTMTSYTGTNTLSASLGSISPTSTAAFTNGVWTGTVTLDTTGSITISTSGSGATGTSNPFTVYTPALTSFKITASGGGNIGTQTAGTAFSITITAIDQEGNTMTGYTGTATLTDTSGSIYTTAPGTSTTGAFANGVWTGSVTITKATASDAVTATSGAAKGTSNTFTVNHAATAVSITVSPASATITAGNTETYTATATDAYGNTWTATGVTWSISSGAGGSWNQGTGTYTSHTASVAGTPWTVTATLGTVKGTASLTVNAGALSEFSFSTIGTQTSGTAFTVTITAEDAYGNTVNLNQAETLVLHNVSGSGTPTLTPTSVTFTNGVATPSITITCTGTHTVYLYINGYQFADNSNTFTV